jgi:D-lactate dehydrogenase (cytochrome)
MLSGSIALFIARMTLTASQASVAEQAEMVQKITADYGGANFSWTTRPEDRQKLWRARHDVV